MTTQKKPFTLEWAISEAMRKPPHGLGAVAVAGILGKSTDLLYKACNPNARSVDIWETVSLLSVVSLSAALVAGGMPDYIIPAIIHERDNLASLQSPDCIDKSAAVLMSATSEVLMTLASARDPDSPSGTDIAPCEGIALLASLASARAAIENKIMAVTSAIKKDDGHGFPIKRG